MASTTFTVRFPPAKGTATTSDPRPFKLLELPPELVKVIEDKDTKTLQNITIRGKTNDEAVLCTSNSTYSIRSVQLSNSYLVVTGASRHVADEMAEDLVIQDSVREVLELVPVVPKLERLAPLLRESAYKGDDEDDEDEMNEEPPNKRRRYTHEQVKGLVQASDVELLRGLKQKRILEIDGYLQPLPADRLTHILTLALTLIPTHSWKPSGVPLKKLSEELFYEHGIQQGVTRQICNWFGYLDEEEKWVMDEQAVVTEIGLGLLQKHKHDARTEDEILAEWREQVGDLFEQHVVLNLLAGNYIDIIDPEYSSRTTKPIEPRYRYFPASDLPTAPQQRFADLFLTKKSWKTEELTPFLQDIAVDKKERDKLLMKFTRSSTTADGTKWYSSRAGAKY